MNCETWTDQIALMVDGEPATAALAGHLAQCSQCSALLRAMQADQDALRTQVTMEEDAVPWVRHHLTNRLRTRRRFRWLSAAGAVAAAVAILLLSRKPAPAPATLSAVIPPVTRPVPQFAPPVVKSPKPVNALRKKTQPKQILDWEAFLDEFSPPPETPSTPPPKPEGLQTAVRIPTSNPDVIILMFQQERIGASQ